MWKLRTSTTQTNKEASPEEKQPVVKTKRFKRWHVVLAGIFCLLLAGLLAWRSLTSYIHTLASETPLPSAPAYEELIIPENNKKTDLYEQEMFQGKREEKAAQKKQNRWEERMRVIWTRFYGKEDVVEPTATLSAPPEAPRARIRRVYRHATRSVTKPPVKQVEKIPEVAFNLKKGFLGKTKVLHKTMPQGIQPQFAQLVRAVIAGDQNVLPGETVKLQLAERVQIGGYLLPAHAMVTGICGFRGGRVQIEVKQVIMDGRVMPVSFTVYDQDKAPGLAYADPKLARQLRRETARGIEQGIPSIPLTGIGLVDQLGHTASTLGKTLIRHTAQGRRTIELSDNYPILLNIQLQ